MTKQKPGKTVHADYVSILLVALGSTTISKSQYEMMSALDGTRTASSFRHQFRSITTKAKELKKRREDGETFEPVDPLRRHGAGASMPSTPSTPKKRKAESDVTPTKQTPKTPKTPLSTLKLDGKTSIDLDGINTQGGDTGPEDDEEHNYLVKVKEELM